MRKILLVSIMGLICTSLYAQQQDALQKAVTDQMRKDKEKSDKAIADPKANVKASTWLSRAKTYEGIALRHSEIDSSAALTAMEAYKKVVELDKNKKGEAGKDAKESEKILTGGETSDLYSAFLNQAVQKYQIKKMGEAYTFFEHATKLYAKDTTAALYGAISAQQSDNNENAIKGFERFIANGGKDAGIYYTLGQLYKTDKKYDKALETIKKGLEKNPNHQDLKAEIVNIMIVSGKEDEAIKELTNLVAAEPNNVTNVLNLAIMYDNGALKSNGQVRQLEEKLSASTSKKAKLEKQLADEKSKLEGFDIEIKRLSGLIAKKPKNLADLNRQLGEAKKIRQESSEELGKVEADIKGLAAVASSVDKDAVSKELATAKAKNKEQKDKALEYYQKALSIDPKNYDALYSVGVFYYNEAVEIKKEVDNMNMQEYQQRGREVEGRICGRFKKAKPFFERAVAERAESDAKENLNNVKDIISKFESQSIPCAEN